MIFAEVVRLKNPFISLTSVLPNRDSCLRIRLSDRLKQTFWTKKKKKTLRSNSRGQSRRPRIFRGLLAFWDWISRAKSSQGLAPERIYRSPRTSVATGYIHLRADRKIFRGFPFLDTRSSSTRIFPLRVFLVIFIFFFVISTKYDKFYAQNNFFFIK